MADAPAALVLRVFTHPACSGCGRVVQEAWEVSRRHPAVALRTVGLERKEGLDEAHAEGVKTIPTLILSRGGGELARWVGTPPPGAIEAEIARRSPQPRAEP